MDTPPTETPPPTPSPPPPAGPFGLTKAQWQIFVIGAVMMLLPLVFVIIILVINFAR